MKYWAWMTVCVGTEKPLSFQLIDQVMDHQTLDQVINGYSHFSALSQFFQWLPSEFDIGEQDVQ